MKGIAVLAAAFLLSTGIAGAAQQVSFEVIPGVALGPLVLGMTLAKAVDALPEQPRTIDTRQSREDNGVVRSVATVRWEFPTGEESAPHFINVDFENGKLVSAFGDDVRFAYRGKNLYDLTFEDVLKALGAPEDIGQAFGFIRFDYTSKGVRFLFDRTDAGWRGTAVGVMYREP